VNEFNDWRLAAGAHLGQVGLGVLCALAGFALALSAASLWGARRKRTVALLFALRAGAIAACLLVALEPTLELRKVSHVPNHVAVLVDASRSMDVRPPDGGPSRAARAAALVARSAEVFDRWQKDGHRVDLYSFGEALAPATPPSLAAGPPAGEATRIGEALGEVRARYAGRDLGAVVVLSDGIDTGRIGPGPLDGETRSVLTALGVPVHAVALGEKELRDLSVAAVLTDEFAFVRTPVKLGAIVRHSGLGGRLVEVTLRRDGRAVDTKTVTLSKGRSEHAVSFDWTPDHPGSFVFEVATPVLGGEALASNNAQVFTLKVIRDRVRVLHLCGRPSWDERFLRSMLRRDPNVDLVSFFILRTELDNQPSSNRELSLIPFPHQEIFEEQLRSFDVLVFQNFNYAPYHVETYLPGVRDYVESGGALAMIGGDLSFASGGYGGTALRDVLPVELDPAAPGAERGESLITADTFKPRLTAEGRAHPVTSLVLDPRENEARWNDLPALDGINRVGKLRAGATTLLAHPTRKDPAGRGAPVLVVGEAGKGRSLALLTDTAWHWGFLSAGAGGDGRSFQRFWENAIRWLVRDPALTQLRVDLDRIEYRSKQAPSARIRTLRTDYTPAAGVAVTLELAEIGAAPKIVRTLAATTNQEGEAHIEIGAVPPGAYRLTGRATLDGRPSSADRIFIVRVDGRELEDVVARDGVLAEIARATGGELRRSGDLAGLTIASPRAIRVSRARSVELWSSPLLLVLGVGLLATEWLLRRRAGHG